MQVYELTRFGLENLQSRTLPAPTPEPGQVVLRVRALSLNYRDLMVIRGDYNPKLRLPVIPLSDAAGEIDAVGPGVTGLSVGDRVLTHFVSGWQSGPYRGEYQRTTLGTPGPGLAAERVALPADAVLRIPAHFGFTEAATLPIAALTAWSALVTEGEAQPGQTVLTLGTGGVSIFALQIAKALGASVIITSSSNDKLARASRLGADHVLNYRQNPDWDQAVLDLTQRAGVDLTIETVGGGSLDRSLRATRPGGRIALLGALEGVRGEVQTGLILMKRIRVSGILVDSREAFERMLAFFEKHAIQPVIDRVFPFSELRAAMEHMQSGSHFGKIVISVP